VFYQNLSATSYVTSKVFMWSYNDFILCSASASDQAGLVFQGSFLTCFQFSDTRCCTVITTLVQQIITIWLLCDIFPYLLPNLDLNIPPLCYPFIFMFKTSAVIPSLFIPYHLILLPVNLFSKAFISTFSLNLSWVVPWFRQLSTKSSLHSPGLNPRPVHVGFVVD
jgi:hypothetical protein